MNHLKSNFVKKVIRTVEQQLFAIGFQKRKLGILSCESTRDTIGWIGLNIAAGRGDGIFEINPIVGVRNQRIERIVAELNNDLFNELSPPSLSGNIGYLMPENRYLPFLFREEASIEAVGDKLCETVKTYGMPFIKKLSDLASLVEAMANARFRINEIVVERIPVGLWLLGDKDGVELFLADQLMQINNRNDPAAIKYKNFAKKLQERVVSDKSQGADSCYD